MGTWSELGTSCRKGNAVYRWVPVKNTPHMITRWPVGMHLPWFLAVRRVRVMSICGLHPPKQKQIVPGIIDCGGSSWGGA